MGYSLGKEDVNKNFSVSGSVSVSDSGDLSKLTFSPTPDRGTVSINPDFIQGTITDTGYMLFDDGTLQRIYRVLKSSYTFNNLSSPSNSGAKDLMENLETLVGKNCVEPGSTDFGIAYADVCKLLPYEVRLHSDKMHDAEIEFCVGKYFDLY